MSSIVDGLIDGLCSVREMYDGEYWISAEHDLIHVMFSKEPSVELKQKLVSYGWSNNSNKEYDEYYWLYYV